MSDHRAGGLLLIRGQGIAAGSSLPTLETHELASSIAAELKPSATA
jgi:hypothetical protein